jgi:hypothetical protein
MMARKVHPLNDHLRFHLFQAGLGTRRQAHPPVRFLAC